MADSLSINNVSSIQYVFDKTVQTKVQQLANQRAATVTQVRQDLGFWTLDLGPRLGPRLGLALGPAAGCTLVRPEGGFGRGAGGPARRGRGAGRPGPPPHCLFFFKNLCQPISVQLTSLSFAFKP